MISIELRMIATPYHVKVLQSALPTILLNNWNITFQAKQNHLIIPPLIAQSKYHILQIRTDKTKCIR